MNVSSVFCLTITKLILAKSFSFTLYLEKLALGHSNSYDSGFQGAFKCIAECAHNM